MFTTVTRSGHIGIKKRYIKIRKQIGKKNLCFAFICNVPFSILSHLVGNCPFVFSPPDPKIKEHVQNYLEGNHRSDKARMISTSSHVSRSSHRVTSSDPSQSRPSRIPTIIRSPIHSSSKSCPQSPQDQTTKSNKASHIQQKSNGGTSNIFDSHDASVKKKCGFEAYMMTGDLILNLSRNQQSADILTTQLKKVHTHTRARAHMLS